MRLRKHRRRLPRRRVCLQRRAGRRRSASRTITGRPRVLGGPPRPRGSSGMSAARRSVIDSSSESVQTRSSPSLMRSREPGADLLARPEEALDVLHPLEVARRRRRRRSRGCPAGRGCRGRRGSRRPRASSGPFAPSATSVRRDAAGVVAGQLVLGARRGRARRTGSSSSSAFVTDARRREARQPAVVATPGVEGRRCRARAGCGGRRRGRRRRSTFAPRPAQLVRGDRADLAEALDDAALCRPAASRAAGTRVLDDHDDADARSPRAAGRSRRPRAACRSRSPGTRGRPASSTCPSSRPSSARRWPCPARECRVCGPITGRSSAVKRRVSRSSSPRDSSRGSQRDAALRAAVRQPQERALPRHPHRERRALAERDAPGRSGCRPWSGRATASAAPGSRGRPQRSRRPASRASRRRVSARGSAAPRRGPPSPPARSTTCRTGRRPGGRAGRPAPAEARPPEASAEASAELTGEVYAARSTTSVSPSSASDADLVADVGSLVAARPPELPLDRTWPCRPARRDDRARSPRSASPARPAPAGAASTRARNRSRPPRRPPRRGRPAGPTGREGRRRQGESRRARASARFSPVVAFASGSGGSRWPCARATVASCCCDDCARRSPPSPSRRRATTASPRGWFSKAFRSWSKRLLRCPRRTPRRR